MDIWRKSQPYPADFPGEKLRFSGYSSWPGLACLSCYFVGDLGLLLRVGVVCRR